MRTLQFRAALLALLVNGSAFAAEPLAAEQLSVESLPPKSPHWVYVVDEAFSNEIDARVRLFDGDSYRHLGQIDAGFTPGVTQSPDGKTTAVATTYFARGGHGARTDVVEFTDNSTLSTAAEITLPPKRAMIPPSYFNLGYSADGRFVYVSYITPAASFGVLDPANKTVLGEVDTAGCVLVIPSGPNRVSSLCDNGRLLTVTLDPQGHEASRALSDVLFDPDADPIFVQGVPTTNGYAFVSFLGQGARRRLLRCATVDPGTVVAGQRCGTRPLASGWHTDWGDSPPARTALSTDASRRRRFAQGRRHRDLGIRPQDAPAPGTLADGAVAAWRGDRGAGIAG